MANKYMGGCACGAVRYETSADPIMQVQCQCRDCQKTTGTGHASFIAFPKAAVKLTGRTTEYKSKADSGNTVMRAFCPTCGSHVHGTSSGFPDMITLQVGSLDDPGPFKPQFVAYNVRAHGWDHLDPALPKFERMPPAA